MAEREPPRALRLYFRFERSRVSLESAVPVEMIAPRSPGPPPRGRENKGTWVELQSASKDILFHRLLRDPFDVIAEHHSPDGHIERVVRPVGSGTFDVLVPELEATDEVVLWAPPPDEVDGRATEERRYKVPSDEGRPA